MNDGTDGDGLINRIDSGIVLGQFPDERQFFIDLCLAEVAQVQMDHVAINRRNGAALRIFMDKRLREACRAAPIPWLEDEVMGLAALSRNPAGIGSRPC